MEPSWTDIAGVALIGAQLIVLVVAAIVARHQVAEARRLREEQSRPFVVIDFELVRHRYDLEVSNLGTSMARDVRFQIDPPLESTHDRNFAELKLLSEGVSTLAPGKRIRTIFDSSVTRWQSNLPTAYDVVVTYTDETGRRSFAERMSLDLGIYRGTRWVMENGLHEINDHLKELVREQSWKAGSSGLLVLSPAELAEREREWQAQWDQSDDGAPE